MMFKKIAKRILKDEIDELKQAVKEELKKYYHLDSEPTDEEKIKIRIEGDKQVMDDQELASMFVFKDSCRPPLLCRPNCCLFCNECTDIYYDLLGGPCGIVCSKRGDFETGMRGKCEMFSEKQERRC